MLPSFRKYSIFQAFEMQELSDGTTSNSKAHEEEPKDLEVGISIHGLVKVYKEVCIRTTTVDESLHLHYSYLEASPPYLGSIAAVILLN